MSSANGSATASPRAVVLAGGVGTRLPPHSTEFPKPLVPLGGELAVIEVVLRQLRRQGFARITLAIGNLGGLVRAYCEDGSRWGIDLDYWTEDVPLGTMGPVIQHLDEVPEHLIVTNGDVLTDLDRRAFLADHIRSGASLSVATSERSTEVDFGVVEVAAGRIVGFHEKPAFPIVASMGVYAISSAVLSRYAAGAAVGFDQVVLDLIEAGDPPRAVSHDGLWFDLGRPAEYLEADRRWSELAPLLLPDLDDDPDSAAVSG